MNAHIQGEERKMETSTMTLGELVRLAALNVFRRAVYIDFDENDLEQHEGLAEEIEHEFHLLMETKL